MADDSNWIRILEMGHDAAKVMWKITKFMYSKFHLRSIIMRIMRRLDANSRYSSNFISLELWVNCIYWSFQLFFFTYFRGKQTANFKVITGAPLPFSFDLLSPALQYGNRCFTKYPEGMPDYFKQAFPAGMSYERTFTFEDGGVATASGHIRYVMNYKCG